MATADQTIQEVREHIIAGRYNEARKLLKTSNHPKTDEWIVKLNALQRDKTQPHRSQRDLQLMSAVTGKNRTTQTTPVKSPTAPAEPKSREKALYKNDIFTITRQDVIIRDAIYPLRQMTAVEIHASEQPDHTIRHIFQAVSCLAACVIAILLFHDKPIFGMVAALGAAGIFSSIGWLIWKMWSAQVPRSYTLRFKFNLVDEDVFESPNKALITEIVSQINNVLSGMTQPSRTALR
jgi:hypothetical protein